MFSQPAVGGARGAGRPSFKERSDALRERSDALRERSDRVRSRRLERLLSQCLSSEKNADNSSITAAETMHITVLFRVILSVV